MSLPAPYFQDGGITIYHGCNREISPLLGKFDAMVTDPPYGIGADNRKRNLSRSTTRSGVTIKATDFGESNWDDKTPSLEWLLQLASFASGSIIWGGNYFGLPGASGWLVWDKDNTGDFADCELAWTNIKMAVRKFKYRWNGMLQEFGGADKEKRVHPTQKPVPLMAWCLSFVPDAKTVFDPYMGSGSVLEAARDKGLTAVGIEREERYCEIAARRFDQKLLFQ